MMILEITMEDWAITIVGLGIVFTALLSLIIVFKQVPKFMGLSFKTTAGFNLISFHKKLFAVVFAR